MGSAIISDTKTQVPMAENNKKSIKKFLKGLFHKDKKKDKKIEEKCKNEDAVIVEQAKVDAVETLHETFRKLELEKKDNDELLKKDNEEDDELKNFTVKVIEIGQSQRDSSESEDSGFTDSPKEFPGKDEDVATELLQKLKIEDKSESEKKLRTVYVARAPVRSKVSEFTPSSHPYTKIQQELSDSHRQISQINRQTLSGGQVTVNPSSSQPQPICNDLVNPPSSQPQLICNDLANPPFSQPQPICNDLVDPLFSQTQPICSDLDIALEQLQNDHSEVNWQDIFELIQKDDPSHSVSNTEVFPTLSQEIEQFPNIMPSLDPEPDPAKRSSPYVNDEIITDIFGELIDLETIATYPTPPRSEYALSPMSETLYPASCRQANSPVSSPMVYNNDLETYQDISAAVDSHTSSDETLASPPESMKKKQYKDLQKEIVAQFLKKQCCQIRKKSCRDIIIGHLEKLELVERRNVALNVSRLDLNQACGVLLNILLGISQGCEELDIQIAPFFYICERVLGEAPVSFLEDFGLKLLKSAALRCPHLPYLTGYLVQCIRTVLKVNPSLAAGKNNIFHEVDARGDNLVIACARAGDVYGDVLAELVRPHAGQPSLFRIHHANTDGYTALHVASSQHSQTLPHLYIVHILLEHAKMDIWKGDVKANDTALHLAVNSASCDLHLILVLFYNIHTDLKKWKELANYKNLSSKTPLDYARSATKSTTRHNYPVQVLDFLKKCR